MQIVTTAFVTMLWEVVVCILVCIERGDGSSLLGARAMARPSYLPRWRHLSRITVETVPVPSKSPVIFTCKLILASSSRFPPELLGKMLGG